MRLGRLAAQLLLVAGTVVAAPAPAQSPSAPDAEAEVRGFMQKGDLAGALARVENLLAKNPREERARFLKGLILVQAGRHDDAIRIFSELAKDYPEHPEPHNNLAVLYAARGDYERARASLEAALRIRPLYATAHENLGDVHMKLARQAYERALQIDPSLGGARAKSEGVKNLFAAHGQSERAAVSAAPAGASKAAASAAPAESRPTAPLIDTLNRWAKAWSDRDVASYLALYSPAFKVPGGGSRAKWEAQRRSRIEKADRIEVRIEGPQFESVADDRAKVTFTQHYRSGTFEERGQKTIVLTRQGGRWLIEEERMGR